MKTQIQKVQQYFKNKLLIGDFEVAEIDKYNMTILIDNEYQFVLWIAIIDDIKKVEQNTLAYSFNFMKLNITPEDEIKLYNVVLPHINEHKKNQDLEKIKELEFQLKTLKNE